MTDELLLEFNKYDDNSYAVVRAEGGSFDGGTGDLCSENCGKYIYGSSCSCNTDTCGDEGNCCPGICLHCASGGEHLCDQEGPSINNTAILDGFTIRGANADDENPGGAIYGVNAAPQILNCTIEQNWATSSDRLQP